MSISNSLPELGWSPFFQQQLSLQEWEECSFVRVVAHHRSNIEVMGEQGQLRLPLVANSVSLTVGDWLLLDADQRILRRLERQSLFSRKAAGTRVAEQFIAANIDTLFVVSSLNDDFNPSRIERYLALAHEAGVEPVLVLTKADCCDQPESYVEQARSIAPMLSMKTVNALDQESSSVLEPWCGPGQTVALLGSSGVGKSTLLNTLLGKTSQATAGIRQDDSKGRHTTTARSMHFLEAGGMLLDTPGMRELQLGECEHGLEEAFNDIIRLAESCRFKDCRHQEEPGCAVREAVRSGRLEQRRLDNYAKLLREQAINAESLAERRARDRGLGRYYRSVQKASTRWKRGE